MTFFLVEWDNQLFVDNTARESTNLILQYAQGMQIASQSGSQTQSISHSFNLSHSGETVS